VRALLDVLRSVNRWGLRLMQDLRQRVEEAQECQNHSQTGPSSLDPSAAGRDARFRSEVHARPRYLLPQVSTLLLSDTDPTARKDEVLCSLTR
jgi:hypothetical protein